ncbi:MULTISPECIES: hypothetical protein [unclassified Nocardioides]|uniref:hypothetical protein n=1 Tax=unclassified Nocardioides TaxID=2615069 RepID=UPI0030153786
MTHDDLSTLLRDHVAHDEPPAPLPTRSVSAGRRRVRNRRLLATGGTVAALALAGAIAVPLVSGDDAPGRGSGIDPASAAALEAYDARRMPTLMDDHVRAVLGRSAPDLGPSTFAARDADGTDLPERYWKKASNLSVTYGGPEQQWEVSISHARSDAEGDPERHCREGLADGSYLECTVDRTDDGDVVVINLWALRPMRGGASKVVNASRLDAARLETLSFERRVKVIKSETLITYASEKVRATDRDPATAVFATSYDDLAEIGTDPELVMPVPPRGENGCPTWTWSRPGESVSCE